MLGYPEHARFPTGASVEGGISNVAVRLVRTLAGWHTYPTVQAEVVASRSGVRARILPTDATQAKYDYEIRCSCVRPTS